MVSSSFFQSIGMAGKSDFPVFNPPIDLFIALSSYPAALLGYRRRWGSIPVADFIASITTGLMLGWQLKKFKTGGLNNAKDSVAL